VIGHDAVDVISAAAGGRAAELAVTARVTCWTKAGVIVAFALRTMFVEALDGEGDSARSRPAHWCG